MFLCGTVHNDENLQSVYLFQFHSIHLRGPSPNLWRQSASPGEGGSARGAGLPIAEGEVDSVGGGVFPRPEGFHLDLDLGGDVGEGAAAEESYAVWLVGEGGFADRCRRCGDSTAAEAPPLGLGGLVTVYRSWGVRFALRSRFSQPCSRDEREGTNKNTSGGKQARYSSSRKKAARNEEAPSKGARVK